MYYGVSYYPEHKNQEDLEHDIRLIKESGINTVRMAEFAWSRLEPSEGEFDFEWLDPVIEELGKAGIKTLMCTPTACPPAWMIEKHPDILYLDNRGITRPFGGRRHYCYNNEHYRNYSARITEVMAKHYGNHKYVNGFQIDNELAQEGTGRCTCPTCTIKFRDWLKDKYKDIETLNERTGGAFWSQEYTNFSQINPPVNTIEVGAQDQIRAFYENPSIRLDFERFSSDSLIGYQDIQTKILKQHTKYPVTTNATGLATNSIDYYKATKDLDCYGFDYYPGLRDTAVDSFPYAFARGIKNGKPFWVMEFMSGGGHRLSGSGRVQPNPEALKQAVIQSFAHGSEMMLHFQFRTFPFGAEQLNYAIVDMDGVPRRRYYEMQETAEILRKLEPVTSGGKFLNEVAVCVDYDSHWALRIKPVNDPEFNYLDYCGKIYHSLSEVGVNSDVISYEHDFSQYKVVVLPAAFVLSVEMRDKLKEYVKQGGVLLSTFLTSVKNPDNIGYTESLPAGLTDLFGTVVEEVEPIFEGNHNRIKIEDEGFTVISADDKWSELLSENSQVIGRYLEDYKEGSGVISKNSYGQGTAYYMGSDLEKDALKSFLLNICENKEVFINEISANDKIEVVRRNYEGKDVYFVFNFTNSEAEISIPGDYVDYLSGQVLANKHTIARNGFLVAIQNDK